MAVIHVISGLGILLSAPLVFHLTAFQKNTGFNRIMTSVLVGEYILTFYLILFGILGLFQGEWILITALFTSALVGLVVRNKKIQKEKTSIRFPFGVSLIFLLFLAIIQNYTYPSVISLFIDFPWARLIVREAAMLPFHLANEYYILYKPPLLPSHVALLFSFQENFSIYITRSIALFYSFFTIFLLMKWSSSHGEKTPYFVLLALFGWWPAFFVDNSRATEEIPLLFFTTCSLYFFSDYLKTRKKENLISLSISLSLAMSSDIVGYFLAFAIFCALLYKSSERYRIVACFGIVLIPVFIWILRNYYYYGFDPLSFVGGFQPSAGKISRFLEPSGFVNIQPSLAIRHIIASYPFLFLAFVHIFKNIREYEKKIVLLIFALQVYHMGPVSFDETTRYYHHFIGIFALYSGIELSKIYDLIPFKTLKRNKGQILIILILISSIYSFGRIHNQYASWDKYDINAHRDLIEFLEKDRGDKETIRIFGEFAPALNWYGDAVRVYPESPLFGVLSNHTEFSYDRSSEYYHQIFEEIGADYIYDGPNGCDEIKWYCFDPLIRIIEKDEKHFELVYADEGGYRLWRVIKSN